jgi:tetratricopeptide (TPR) repeat protein
LKNRLQRVGHGKAAAMGLVIPLAAAIACSSSSRRKEPAAPPPFAVAAAPSPAAPVAPLLARPVDPRALVATVSAQLSSAGLTGPTGILAAIAATKRGDGRAAAAALTPYDGQNLFLATMTAIALGAQERVARSALRAVAEPLLRRFNGSEKLNWGFIGSHRVLAALVVAAEAVLGEETIAPFLRGIPSSVGAALACTKAEQGDVAAGLRFAQRIDQTRRTDRAVALGCVALVRKAERDFEDALAAAVSPPYIASGDDRSGNEEAEAVAELIALFARGPRRLGGLPGGHAWVRRAGEALLRFKWGPRGFRWAFGVAREPAAERGRSDADWRRLAEQLTPFDRIPRPDPPFTLATALPSIVRELQAPPEFLILPAELAAAEAEALLAGGRSAQALERLLQAPVGDVARYFDALDRALAGVPARARAEAVERLVSRAASEKWITWGLGPTHGDWGEDPSPGCAVVRLTRIFRTLGAAAGRPLVARLEKLLRAKSAPGEALTALHAEWSLALQGEGRRRALEAAFRAARAEANRYRLEESLRRIVPVAGQELIAFLLPAEKGLRLLYWELGRVGRGRDAVLLAAGLSAKERSRFLQMALDKSADLGSVRALGQALEAIDAAALERPGDSFPGNARAYHDGARGGARLRLGDVDGALAILAKMEFGSSSAREKLACAIGRAFSEKPAFADLRRLGELRGIVERFIPQEVRGAIHCLAPRLLPLLPPGLRTPYFDTAWKRIGTLTEYTAPAEAARAAGLRHAGDHAEADAALERALETVSARALDVGGLRDFVTLGLEATQAAPARRSLRARVLGALGGIDPPNLAVRRAAAAASRWCLEHDDHVSVPALFTDRARLRPAARAQILAAWMQEALAFSKTPVADIGAVIDVLAEGAEVVRLRASLLRAALWREKRFDDAARLPLVAK